MGAIEIAPGTEYLTYISPAWVTEQIFGLSIGLIAPMVVNFPEGPEDVLTNIRELAVDALVFSPRQWENLASIVQAFMWNGWRGVAPALPHACSFPLPKLWCCITCATILALVRPKTQ